MPDISGARKTYPVGAMSAWNIGDYSFGYAVGLTRWSMRMLGLWPMDERFSTLKWTVGIIVTMSFLVPSMARMLTLTDPRSIIEQAVLTVPLCLLLMKLSYIRVKSDNFRMILQVMIEDWSEFKRLPVWAREIMIVYARRGRAVNIVCISSMMISTMGYMTLPSGGKFNEGIPKNVSVRKLPTEGLYPFDEKQSPNYELIYASQAVVSCLYCMITFSIDCFLCLIVFHVCGQLSMLAKTLESYGTVSKHQGTKRESFYTCACLKCIVQRHVLITDYMSTIERSFNEFVLLQLVGNCFILAVEGYGVVTYAEDNNTLGFLTFIAYTGTVTYNIFIYCYIGDLVMEKSERIADTAYNLEWNNLPQNFASPLILLMIRSRRSCRITAGRFAVMTLAYYKNILTTSISYISVLRAIK